MTKNQREELLYVLLREMRCAHNKKRRYALQVIGEGLLGEYLDMDYHETKIKIEGEDDRDA